MSELFKRHFCIKTMPKDFITFQCLSCLMMLLNRPMVFLEDLERFINKSDCCGDGKSRNNTAELEMLIGMYFRFGG